MNWFRFAEVCIAGGMGWIGASVAPWSLAILVPIIFVAFAFAQVNIDRTQQGGK